MNPCQGRSDMLHTTPADVRTQAIGGIPQGETEKARRRASRPGAHPARIDRGALQEVREARVPLRQGQRTRACLLPLRYARRRKDTVLLSPSEAQENSWTVPTQFQEASPAHRAARRDQSRAARAPRAGSARVVRAISRSRALYRRRSSVSPLRLRTPIAWFEDCGRSWCPCCWSNW